MRNKNAAVKRCFKKYFFYILLQVSVRPDMYAEFSWLFLPAAILCTLRNSCHWLGKVWFVPMKYLKAHKIRSQLTNLFATKGRFPEKKRPHGKIQNSSKDDRRWNALHWGTGFPRLQSKYHWKSSLFWLGKAGCLKVSSNPDWKTVTWRNLSLSEKAVSWGGRVVKMWLSSTLPWTPGFWHLTPGDKPRNSLSTDQDNNSEDRLKSFSLKSEKLLFFCKIPT